MLTTAALMLATAIGPSSDVLEAWGLCLQFKVSVEAQEEPDASFVVAVAFEQCSFLEPQVRSWLVAGVAAQLDDPTFAEAEGDLMLSALRISQTEDLLRRARGMIAARRN